jgi:hypothetical protein
MSVHNYKAGARTRNVVNIAKPGGSGAAYSLTEANSIPSAATDGFKNFNSQKTLHVVIHNNALVASGPTNVNVSDISIWGYNSSLGGVWTMLTRTDRASGAETLVHPTYSGLSVAHDGVLRLIIPIEGIERIAVRAETFSATVTGGTLDVYLGVNSI